MEDRPVIMVQAAEPDWTYKVLHAACALAHACAGEIAIVQMVRARHPMYLGRGLGFLDLDDDYQANLKVYVDIIEEYRLGYTLTLYQYCSLADAIVEAAETLTAKIVFAKLPPRIVPLWSAGESAWLHFRLSRRNIELFSDPVIWNVSTPKRLGRTRSIASQSGPTS